MPELQGALRQRLRTTHESNMEEIDIIVCAAVKAPLWQHVLLAMQQNIDAALVLVR